MRHKYSLIPDTYAFIKLGTGVVGRVPGACKIVDLCDMMPIHTGVVVLELAV